MIDSRCSWQFLPCRVSLTAALRARVSPPPGREGEEVVSSFHPVTEPAPLPPLLVGEDRGEGSTHYRAFASVHETASSLGARCSTQASFLARIPIPHQHHILMPNIDILQ